MSAMRFALGFASLTLGRTAKAPLITTDLFYNTVEILTDARDFVWKQADVDGLLAKVPVEQLKTEITKQVGPVPKEVSDAALQAQAAYVQAKAAALDFGMQAYEPMDKAAVSLIDQFETQVPAYKGLVPKSLGNFVLFVCFKLLVLYVMLKVLLLALKIVWGITKFVLYVSCCCCLCRGGGKKEATNGKANGKKAAATNGKAASNGKSAPAGKAAAKPAAKKKA